MKELTKILYAEDEPDIQIVVETIFESFGKYELKTCSDGIEVLDNIKEYQPDLVLLDIMMPKLDGLSVFSKLQENEKTKNFPVIFMTAKVQSHEVESYLETGALGIITKPFDPLNLCSEIEAIWQKQFN